MKEIIALLEQTTEEIERIERDMEALEDFTKDFLYNKNNDLILLREKADSLEAIIDDLADV